MITAPQLLREAADHIEKVGHNQDGFYYRHGPDDDRPEAERPCCAVGAMRVIYRKHVSLFTSYADSVGVDQAMSTAKTSLAALVTDETRFGPHDAIVDWSDKPETTQEEVVAKFRATADKLEKEIAV